MSATPRKTKPELATKIRKFHKVSNSSVHVKLTANVQLMHAPNLRAKNFQPILSKLFLSMTAALKRELTIPAPNIAFVAQRLVATEIS